MDMRMTVVMVRRRWKGAHTRLRQNVRRRWEAILKHKVAQYCRDVATLERSCIALILCGHDNLFFSFTVSTHVASTWCARF